MKKIFILLGLCLLSLIGSSQYYKSNLTIICKDGLSTAVPADINVMMGNSYIKLIQNGKLLFNMQSVGEYKFSKNPILDEPGLYDDYLFKSDNREFIHVRIYKYPLLDSDVDLKLIIFTDDKDNYLKFYLSNDL